VFVATKDFAVRCQMMDGMKPTSHELIRGY